MDLITQSTDSPRDKARLKNKPILGPAKNSRIQEQSRARGGPAQEGMSGKFPIHGASQRNKNPPGAHAALWQE